jgi:hypothetical protein
MVSQVKAYLGTDVVKGGRANDGEADEENIGLRVRERSESVIIFLAGSIPQTQTNGLAIDHHTGRVIVEAKIVSFGAQKGGVSCDLHSRDVFAGEGICSI